MADDNKNEHGLSRTIPSAVKRAVRQKCGFGCVICGSFLVDYDHVDPEFKDAKVHDPTKICLLCIMHHGMKTRGVISTEEVKEAWQNPKALQEQFSRENEFIRIKRPLTVKLGNFVFENPTEILRIAGKTLLSVEDTDDGMIALSGEFYNSKGELVLKIEKNECQASTGNWDVEVVGNKMTIREKAYHLALTVTASRDLLVFDNITMRYGNVSIESNFGKGIDIFVNDVPAFQHTPQVEGASIITTGAVKIKADGSLDIGEDGKRVTITAGTLKVGNPDGIKPKPQPASAIPVTQPKQPKIGRNDKCPCGNGLKYKNCHGKAK